MHLMVIFWEVMKIEDVKMVISQGYPRIVEKNAEIRIVDWLKGSIILGISFRWD